MILSFLELLGSGMVDDDQIPTGGAGIVAAIAPEARIVVGVADFGDRDVLRMDTLSDQLIIDQIDEVDPSLAFGAEVVGISPITPEMTDERLVALIPFWMVGRVGEASLADAGDDHEPQPVEVAPREEAEHLGNDRFVLPIESLSPDSREVDELSEAGVSCYQLVAVTIIFVPTYHDGTVGGGEDGHATLGNLQPGRLVVVVEDVVFAERHALVKVGRVRDLGIEEAAVGVVCVDGLSGQESADTSMIHGLGQGVVHVEALLGVHAPVHRSSGIVALAEDVDRRSTVAREGDLRNVAISHDRRRVIHLRWSSSFSTIYHL